MHRHQRSILTAAAALSCGVLPACNLGPFGGSALFFDRQSDQPFAADGRRAKFFSWGEWDFVRSNGETVWKWDDQRVDVDELAESVERFNPRPEPDPPYTPPNIQEGNPDLKLYTYPDTRTIVCVDPVVVLVTPMPTSVDFHDIEGWDKEYAAAAIIKLSHKTVVLPNGYTYGTRMRLPPAHSGQVSWFSPTMEIPETPIHPTREAPATIDTPWGALVIHRTDDGIRIRARKSQTP